MDFEALLGSPILNGIGILLAIASIVLAYVFYRRSLRAKEPTWAGRGMNLVESYVASLDGLEVLFRGKSVSAVSVSRVAFWNAGRETIHGADVARGDPLRIQAAQDVVILDASVVQTNNESNQVRIELRPDGSFAQILFDYLDRDHGAVFRIIHTGQSPHAYNVVGSIKGAERLRFTIVPFAPKWLPLPTTARFDARVSPRIRTGVTIAAKCGFGSVVLITALYVAIMPPRSLARDIVIGLVGAAWAAKQYYDAWQYRSELPESLDRFHDPSSAFSEGPPNKPPQPTSDADAKADTRVS